jgi:D-amino-acid dehydrogenase
MKVFRDPRSFELAQSSMAISLAEGLKVQPLDRGETVALEPALAPIESRIVGSQYYPGDETGDARRYCDALAARLTARGCDLRYNVSVDGFTTRGAEITGARTSVGNISADVYVLASGAYTAKLARPLGLSIPVQPVKGYSISVPMQPWSPRPSLGVVDDTLHAGATPIGDRLRVAGTAEFTGFDTTVTPARVANLQRLVDALYPQASTAARGNDIAAWAGLRPMSADGVPVIGRTPIGNLYVNAGHGTLGWTMAAGSGRLLADLVTTGDTEIDITGYAYARFH